MEFYSQWSSDSCSRRIELAVQQALEEIRRDSFEDDLTSTRPLILTYYPLHRPVHNEAPMEFKEMDELVTTWGESPNRHIEFVWWQPPLYPWVKVNTDGLWRGNAGLSACGGVFRSRSCDFLGGYAVRSEDKSPFSAELRAVLIAIKIAYCKGWRRLWIESDASQVVLAIQNRQLDPRHQLISFWRHCIARMNYMIIHCSHIYREGNRVADALANLGLRYPHLQWWNDPQIEIQHLLLSDSLGIPNIRNRP